MGFPQFPVDQFEDDSRPTRRLRRGEYYQIQACCRGGEWTTFCGDINAKSHAVRLAKEQARHRTQTKIRVVKAETVFELPLGGEGERA